MIIWRFNLSGIIVRLFLFLFIFIPGLEDISSL
jgi:hypothetical protein